jgi:SAM-dependent methyltransferase
VTPSIDTSRLRPVRGLALIQLMGAIRHRIERDTTQIGSDARLDAWERGWSENLTRFRNDPRIESLIPRFIRDGQPVRIDGEFYDTSNDPKFELRFYHTVQTKIIATLLEDCDSVYEFGCGTGFNLAMLARIYPDKQFVGTDYSSAAVELVDLVASKLHLPITSYAFDMKRPEGAIRKNSGVFTFGAVEQLAGEFEKFVDWLADQKPRVVVHVEPTPELYDPENEIDALALAFHKKRGYTSGFLPFLQNHPGIVVDKITRHGFGSLMIEGYNSIVWRPR